MVPKRSPAECLRRNVKTQHDNLERAVKVWAQTDPQAPEGAARREQTVNSAYGVIQSLSSLHDQLGRDAALDLPSSVQARAA